MNLVELLAELDRVGIRVWCEDGQLMIQAPKGKLTAQLRQQLEQHKSELIKRLVSPTPGREDSALPKILPAPAERYAPFPLTDIQQAYWVGRDPSMVLGNLGCHFYWEFENANLDIGQLSLALRQLLLRHDMLHAVILPNGVQRVLSDVPPYQIEVTDLSGESPNVAASYLETLRRRMSHQLFASDVWPLFDLRATRLPNGGQRLHVSIDLLMLDGLSVVQLFREWHQLYLDPNADLPALELTFRDYVVSATDFRRTAKYQRSEEYWQSRLPRLPPAPRLPLAQNPAEIKQPRFARLSGRLDSEPWGKLKARAASANLTPSLVLCAAYAEVLSVWSAQTHLTLNVTLFNRPPVHPQIGEVLGNFTSNLLLEVDASGPTFERRAQLLQNQLGQDLGHIEISGVRVLRKLKHAGGRAAGAMPVVFTSMLIHGDEQETNSSWLGDEVYAITQTPQVWLDHQVTEQNGELIFNWDFATGLFPSAMVADMFEAYCGLVERLAVDPASWQEQNRQLVPQSQLDLRRSLNAGQAPAARDLLHQLFAAQAVQRPQQAAVISATRTLSYEELLQRANQLGHLLQQSGARPNSLVAVVMEKGWEQVVAVLGTLISGAAYLPIDASLPQERLHFLLKHGQVKLVLTQSRFDRKLQWPGDVQIICVDSMTPAPTVDPPPLAELRPEDIAYVIYTSGSTGKPKGVVINHLAAVNTILDINKRFNVGPADRVLALSSLSFDLSVYDIFGTLAAGGTIVMPEAWALRDPQRWLELTLQHGVTIWNSVPALMEMLVEYTAQREQDLSDRLRLIMLSGDWIRVTLPGQIKELAPKARVVSLGGATEAAIWSIFYPIDKIDPSWTSIPYGQPLTNQSFHILNERLEPCPVWVTGELFIGGRGVALGYWRDGAKTAASFIPHPATGERLYRTGDRGRYLPDGNIEFQGREDLQIKVGGYRIELGEIETTLAQHPIVHAAAVASIAQNGHNRLFGYIVPKERDQPVTSESASAGAFANPTFRESLRTNCNRQVQQIPPELKDFSSMMQSLDRLSTVYICRALSGLEIFSQPNEAHSIDEMMREFELLPRYRKLLRRWLNALVEDGMLGRRENEVFFAPSPLPLEPVEVLWAELSRYSGEWQQLFQYTRDCGENLINLLQGRLDPLHLLFAEGSWELTEALYQFNPFSRYFNLIASQAVRSMVGAWPESRPLRILEIGAGTGGTTAALLPVLPANSRYVFTDLSIFFTSQGKKKFEQYPFVDYRLLDINRPPLEQGYELHSFDVVVAANVLHDAVNLSKTLRYLQSLLAPDGLLLLLEATVNTRSQMITIAFIEGLSAFEDERLETNLPFLSVNQWRSLIEANGYQNFMVFPEKDSQAGLLGEHVMVAESARLDADVSPVRNEPALSNELKTFLKQHLPDYMIPSGFMVLDTLPLNQNGKVDRKRLPAPPELGSLIAAEHTGPRTETERGLVTIWQDVLQVERTGVHDNFFDLGGDSLLVVQMQRRLRELTGRDVPIVELFRHTTIASLADYLGRPQAEMPNLREIEQRARKQRESVPARSRPN